MGRSNQRISLDLYVNKMINGVPHIACTRDISATGIYLHRLLEPLAPEDAHIAVEFTLPGSDEIIWTEAQMVYAVEAQTQAQTRDKGGVGLRFLHLTPRHARLLEEFLTHQTF
ncbi:PilZ domain-containing protein [Myxococcota bacterium]|nr:PilZ domain-containing protein [Myxococcota bacterium]MBU1900012.1 PilZ domain-containing protein [Myxococcota bacterium]